MKTVGIFGYFGFSTQKSLHNENNLILKFKNNSFIHDLLSWLFWVWHFLMFRKHIRIIFYFSYLSIEYWKRLTFLGPLIVLICIVRVEYPHRTVLLRLRLRRRRRFFERSKENMPLFASGGGDRSDKNKKAQHCHRNEKKCETTWGKMNTNAIQKNHNIFHKEI